MIGVRVRDGRESVVGVPASGGVNRCVGRDGVMGSFGRDRTELKE